LRKIASFQENPRFTLTLALSYREREPTIAKGISEHALVVCQFEFEG
jgi:hypothetical protein